MNFPVCTAKNQDRSSLLEIFGLQVGLLAKISGRYNKEYITYGLLIAIKKSLINN